MNIRDSLKQVKENEKITSENNAFKITDGNHYVKEDFAVKEFKQIADSGAIDQLKSLTDSLTELKNFISSSENLEIIEVSHLIKNLSDAVSWLGEKYNDFEDIPQDIENLKFKIKEGDDFLTERLKADFDDKITKLTARINKNYMGGSGGGIVFLKDADDVDTTSLADGRFIRWDASLNKFIFASASAAAGNIDLANVDMNIEPDQDSIRDLGSDTKKWKDLYLSGSTIRLGTVDLKSNAGTLEIVNASSGLPAPIDTSISISDLSDVSGSPSNDSVLKYNDSTGKWEPASAGVVDYNDLTNKPTIPTELNDFSDVNLASLQNERYIMYDGTKWISAFVTWTSIRNKPTTLAGYGITDSFDGNYNNLTNKPTLFDGDYDSLTNKPSIPLDLNDLSDVSSAVPTTGQVLSWTGTTWMPSDPTAFTNASTLENQPGSYYLDYNNFINTPAILSSLNDLSDVSISSPSAQSVLYYDGSEWIDSSISWSMVTNRPTTLAGYGITDSFDGNYNNLINKPTIPNSLEDLSDVTILNGSPSSGQTLIWSSVSNSWQNASPSVYNNSSVDLHLKTTTASTGDILSWDGTDYAWVADQTGSGGSATLSGLSDTNIGTPQSNDVLTWTANNTWEPQQVTSGSTYTDSDAISAVTGSDLDMNGNKILFNNVYSALGDLPSASTYHGMFAHVHATGAAYYSHAGQWIQLGNNSDLGATTLIDLTDVVFPGTLYDGDTIFWRESTQTWENVPLFDGNFNNLSNKPNLVNLGDVSYSNVGLPQTNDVLVYTANNVWEPQQQSAGTSGGATNLDGLTDTTISSPSSGEFLKWNGSAWVNSSTSLEDLSDVTILNTAQFGQVLAWTGSAWTNFTLAVYNNSSVDLHLNVNTASAGDVLSWNGSDYDWVAQSGGSSISVLSDLTDVSTNTPSQGDVLSWNAGSWSPVASFGGAMNNLTDVNTATNTPQANDVLTWTANNTWEPQESGSTLNNIADASYGVEVTGKIAVGAMDVDLGGSIELEAGTVNFSHSTVVLSSATVMGLDNSDVGLANITDASYGVEVTGKVAASGIDIGQGSSINAPLTTIDFQGSTINFGSSVIMGGNAFKGVIDNHIWAGGQEPTDGTVLSWNASLLAGAGDYEWISQSSGGSASVAVGATAPTSPSDNDLWWDSFEGKLKIYYNDATSSQWVDASPFQQITTLDNLGDFDTVSNPPQTTDVLTWTANNVWEPQMGPGAFSNSDVSAYLNGGWDFHIIPDTNAAYDLGNAEYKVRHLFLSDNSLWIGDEHKISIDNGIVKTKKRKRDTGYWPEVIHTDPYWGYPDSIGSSFDDVRAIDFVNTVFGKTYTDPSEFSLNEMLYARTKQLAEKLPSSDPKSTWDGSTPTWLTIEDLYPAEGTSGYTDNDYDYFFSQEPEGHKIANPETNKTILEIDLKTTKTYFLEQSPNYDPGTNDLTVMFNNAKQTPGSTIEFTVFISNGMHPKNISYVSINGQGATQVRVSGITPVAHEMNTYTIKGVCDSSNNWLLTIHVA